MNEPAAARAAREIHECLTRHPLAISLKGTVLIGSGSVRFVRADDARPRIMIPLSLHHPLSPLGRAYLACADGIVVSNPHEAALLRSAITTDQIVVMPPAATAEPPFLIGTSQDETAEAWAVVAGHEALSAALAHRQRAPFPLMAASAAVADAAIEAIVASTPSAAPRPERE